MTKTIKLSLVAAVAVAGLSTTSSAQDLSNAIKGVDVSGYVRYRGTQTETNTAKATNSNEYKASMTLTAKANDNVKVTTAFYAVGDTKNDAAATNDADVAVVLAKAYFTYANGPLTALVGKHQMGTPFTTAADNRGTGITALYNAGAATLAVAHFANNNIDKSNADELVNVSNTGINVAAVIGAVGPVNAQLWLAETSHGVSNTSTDVDTSTVDAQALLLSGKVANVTLNATYAELDFKTTTYTDSNEKLIVTAATPVAGVNLTAGYVTTGTARDGAAVANGGLTSFDVDAATNFKVEQLAASNLNDAEVIYLAASTNIGPVKATLEYADGDFKTSTTASNTSRTDVTETVVSLSYPMSKNFVVSGYISDYDTQATGATATDSDKTRLEVIYTF